MKRKVLKSLICSAMVCALVASLGGVAASAAELDSTPAVGTEAGADENSELPSYYSSRDLGYVTAVKSQDFNSCWAFASMATFESLLLRNGYEIEDMSTSHLNIWATEHSDGSGWTRTVYEDGYPSIALGYLTSWQGGVFVSDAGDVPLDGTVHSDDITLDSARWGVTSVEYLSKSNPTAIKKAIMAHGGVFTSYAQSAMCQSSDRLSYYMPNDFYGSYAGHSIEVVGWDDNYSKEKFDGMDGVRPENNGAWLIKNSWGNNNSLGGYFWMSYEDAYLFSQKYTPSYALTGFEVIDGTKKLLQNEVYGATYEFGYTNNSTQTYINRFTFDENFNTLDKVIFETKAAGAEYSIYYVPDGENQTPDADTQHWTKLYEGTADAAGYICADIEDFKPDGSAGSIAVTIDTQNSGGNATIGVGEWLTNSSKMVFKNSSRKGESFLTQDGAVVDLMDWYHDNNNDDIGGTFVIKAIAVDKTEPTLPGDANLDGKVNINDVTEIQRYLAEYQDLSKLAKANADYNGDGSITIEDCTLIQFMLAEYET